MLIFHVNSDMFLHFTVRITKVVGASLRHACTKISKVIFSSFRNSSEIKKNLLKYKILVWHDKYDRY